MSKLLLLTAVAALALTTTAISVAVTTAHADEDSGHAEKWAVGAAATIFMLKMDPGSNSVVASDDGTATFSAGSIVGGKITSDFYVVSTQKDDPCVYEVGKATVLRDQYPARYVQQTPFFSINFRQLSAEYQIEPTFSSGTGLTMRVPGRAALCQNPLPGDGGISCSAVGNNLVLYLYGDRAVQQAIRALSYIFTNVCQPLTVRPY